MTKQSLLACRHEGIHLPMKSSTGCTSPCVAEMLANDTCTASHSRSLIHVSLLTSCSITSAVQSSHAGQIPHLTAAPTAPWAWAGHSPRRQMSN